MLWGVDSSYVHADMMVNARTGRPLWRYQSSGRDEITLYEFVRRTMGMQDGEHPDFWGRYLNPHGHAREETRLRPAEKDYIFSASGGHCKILLAYNGIDAGACQASGDAGYRNGYHQGETACLSANMLSVPAGVRIYANIEGPWRITPDWIQGWWDAMAQSQYAGLGGIYGRGAEFTWGQINDPMAEPRHITPLARSIPQASRARSLDPLMQHAAGRGPRPAREVCHIWTNMPRLRCEFPRDRGIPQQFAGVGPSTGIARVMVWQYRYSCFRFPVGGEERGIFDMNMARDEAHADMWSADM